MGRKKDRQFLVFSSSLISCDLVNLRAHSEHPYPWWDPVLRVGGGVPVDQEIPDQVQLYLCMDMT